MGVDIIPHISYYGPMSKPRARIISKKVTTCGECPSHEWEPNVGEGNTSGCTHCRAVDRDVAWDDKDPKIPKWCPLPLAPAKGRSGEAALAVVTVVFMASVFSLFIGSLVKDGYAWAMDRISGDVSVASTNRVEERSAR